MSCPKNATGLDTLNHCFIIINAKLSAIYALLQTPLASLPRIGDRSHGLTKSLGNELKLSSPNSTTIL